MHHSALDLLKSLGQPLLEIFIPHEELLIVDDDGGGVGSVLREQAHVEDNRCLGESGQGADVLASGGEGKSPIIYSGSG